MQIAFRTAKWKQKEKTGEQAKEESEGMNCDGRVNAETVYRVGAINDDSVKFVWQLRPAGVTRLNATRAFIRAANEHYKAAQLAGDRRTGR